MKKSLTKNEYRRLVKEIHEHNRLYYDLNRPKITDDEYDRLMRLLQEAEEEHPEWIEPDSPAQKVGGKPQEGFRTVTHRVPMLSMDNAYSEEELLQFDKRIEKILSRKTAYVVEPKIDGVSISLSYEKGRLIQAVTRGDGLSGDEVTANVCTIKSIPASLKHPERLPDELEIRGEIFMKRADFTALNEKREEEGSAVFANPRNATAGSLKLLEPKIVAERRLQFFAHGIGFSSSAVLKSQMELLETYQAAGLPIQPAFCLCKNMAEVLKQCRQWEKKRESLPYDVDGMVVKVNDFAEQKILGTTAKSPRYLVAYKFQAKRAKTRLVAVAIQVGRTGVLTPVAKLKPVPLSGTVISRATLHNQDEIERLELKIGDTVLIEKSGEIIPQVVAVLKNKRTGKEKSFSMPASCPVCHSEVRQDADEVAVRCVNANCPAQVKARILHFASRKAMDIEGLGEALVGQLVESGLIRKLPDVYQLRADQLEKLERMGRKSAQNIVDAIEKSKSRDLGRLIFGLGIRHVGARSAQTLAQHFGQMDELIAAKERDLESLRDIGLVVGKSIVHFFSNSHNLEMIRDFGRAGLNMKSAVSMKKHPFFAGKTFVVTGTLQNYTREEITERLTSLGGIVSSSVSSRTDYLIAGSEPGSKLGKAKRLEIGILTESDLERRIVS